LLDVPVFLGWLLSVDNGCVSAPYGSPPVVGRLVVDSSFNPMAFLLALTGPKVAINGAAVKVKWGQAAFDLPAGNYYVQVSTRYLGEFGPAQLPVVVYPGQVVTVYYRPAAVLGMNGSLGFQPQKTRGMGVVMALNIAVVLLTVFLVIR
jgi:hypothetical protein